MQTFYIAYSTDYREAKKDEYFGAANREWYLSGECLCTHSNRIYHGIWNYKIN